jgi:predicted nucleotidyltransferase
MGDIHQERGKGVITLLEVLVGSRAYGTATEDSDIDRRVVFAHGTRDLLSVDGRGNCPQKDTVWDEKAHGATRT